MYENVACIIGRSSIKKDVFYFLPWYDTKTLKLLHVNCIQLFFRINGYRKNYWTLEAYLPDDKIVKLHSTEMDRNRSSVIVYNMSDTGFYNSGHQIKYDLF